MKTIEAEKSRKGKQTHASQATPANTGKDGGGSGNQSRGKSAAVRLLETMDELMRYVGLDAIKARVLDLYKKFFLYGERGEEDNFNFQLVGNTGTGTL